MQDVHTWLIYRRYSQFHSLNQELKSTFGRLVPRSFPPKQILQNLSPHHVDRRHQKLQDWLRTVLDSEKLQTHPRTLHFINHQAEDADFVPKYAYFPWNSRSTRNSTLRCKISNTTFSE
jgi:hypothetical protein